MRGVVRDPRRSLPIPTPPSAIEWRRRHRAKRLIADVLSRRRIPVFGGPKLEVASETGAEGVDKHYKARAFSQFIDQLGFVPSPYDRQGTLTP